MNKIYYGDNLDILRKFIRDESIDLCYIDPPFNSKRNYNQIYNNIVLKTVRNSSVCGYLVVVGRIEGPIGHD